MKTLFGFVLAAGLSVGAGAASGAMLVNFESPTYTTGPVISPQQDNWVPGFTGGFSGGATASVTSSSPISGSQSLAVANPNTGGSDFGVVRRDFQAGEKVPGFGLTAPNGTQAVFSYLQRIDTYSSGSTGRAGIVFLSTAAPSGNSPTYLIFHKDGSIEFNSNTSAGSFTPNNDVYRITFTFTFGTGFTNNGQANATVQDVTTSGAVQNLGTINFVGSVVNLSTGFLGFGLIGDKGDAVMFDEIIAAPEPASAGLLLLGAAVPLVRRRRGL